jgi:hypothetical protein
MNTSLPELLEGRAYRVRPNKHANHVVTIGASTADVPGRMAHRVRCECGEKWVVEDMGLFVALQDDEVHKSSPRS